jgi:hypothetical protein
MAVRGVRGIQFVGAANPLDFGVAFDRIADREKVIAGNSEAMIDTFVSKALNDVVGDSHLRHCG